MSEVHESIRSAWNSRSKALHEKRYHDAVAANQSLLKLYGDLVSQSKVDRSFVGSVEHLGKKLVLQSLKGSTAIYVALEKWDASKLVIEPKTALDYIVDEEEARLEVELELELYYPMVNVGYHSKPRSK